MSEAAPLLVIGRRGQLAQELAQAGTQVRRPVLCVGRERLDLLSGAEPGPLLDQLQPGAVINTAAYTRVDQAEAEPEAAFQLNAQAPGTLARACFERGLPFLHVSTDYVFDGRKGAPYVEADLCNPLNVYGASKLEGEAAVLQVGGTNAVLRVSWLFGAFGSNFVKLMRGMALAGQDATVVSDQVGRPTWSRDLAGFCIALAQELVAAPRPIGLLHAAGPDDASWADIAEQVYALAGRPGGVRRTTADQRPTRAIRPKDSRMDSTRARDALGWRPAGLHDALRLCLEELDAADRVAAAQA